MKRIIIALLLFVLMASPSCGIFRRVGLTIIQKDTVYIAHNNNQKDSVHTSTHTVEHIHDSVYVDRIIKEKGDTVLITKTYHHYHNEIREVRDSTAIISLLQKLDSLYIVTDKYEKEVTEVEKPFNKWQKFMMNAGVAFLVVVIFLLVFGAFKLYKKLTIH